MMRKMIIFSILSLLLGLNVYFIIRGILGAIFLGICAFFSILYFVYGILKDTYETRQIREWQKPFSKLLTGKP